MLLRYCRRYYPLILEWQLNVATIMDLLTAIETQSGFVFGKPVEEEK